MNPSLSKTLFDNWPTPRFELRGGVKEAFHSRDSEALCSGAAGTGKSLMWLLRIYWTCRKYPGARCLIVRKTRESLTESILVTWERDILGPTHPILTLRPNLRKVRQAYFFPNGSSVVVGGMDKPDKVLSSEWDIIYAPEATELDITDWETLSGRLRAGSLPYQQMIADCNPTSPEHWIYKRCLAGLCKLFPTTHQDNPRYWDTQSKAWTVPGQQYMARLERMTGTRRKRFLLGLWEAAEGTVYDYRKEDHFLPADWQPEPHHRRVWGIDWGRVRPTVLGMWAFDDEGRMYCYREVYQTFLHPALLGEWCTRQIVEFGEKPPEAVVCDHDDIRKAEFERTSGLSLTLADKTDRDKGIEETQTQFDIQDDGWAKIFFKPTEACRVTIKTDDRSLATVHGPDLILVDRGEPTSGLEEIVGYIWDEESSKDQPIDYNDHFCDMMRYVARYVVANSGGSYTPDPRPRTPFDDLPSGTFGKQGTGW